MWPELVFLGIGMAIGVFITLSTRTKPKPVSGGIVKIDYTNWRGMRAVRAIDPVALVYKKSPWHEKPQWFIEAFDCARKDDMDEPRDFALANIHQWIDDNVD